MSHADDVPEAPSRSGRAGVGPGTARGLGCTGYGSVVRRRLWPIVGLIVALSTLAGVYAFSLEPVYESSTTLLIDRASRADAPILGPSAGGGASLGTEVIVLRSDTLAGRVADRLDLWRHPELDPRQAATSRVLLDPRRRDWLPDWVLGQLPAESPDLADVQARKALIETLTSQLTAEVIPDSEVIRLSFTSHNAELAADVAAAYAETYQELAAEGGLQSGSRGASRLNERLEGLREQVESSERALQAYREDNGLAGTEGALNLADRELAELSERLVEARARGERLRGEHEQAKGLAESDPVALAAHPVVARSAVIQTLTTEEVRAERTVSELEERYGAQHPKMLAARSDLDSIRAKLSAEIADTLTGLQKQYEIADARAELLEADLERMNARVQEERRKELTLRSLERDLDTNRQLYEGLLTRLKEHDLAADADRTEVRVIDVARVPYHPVEPRRLRIILTAALLGLLLGLALALVERRLDHTLRGSEDVEREIRLPSLGTLPLLERGARRQGAHARALLERPHSDFAEAIRTIRSGLVLAKPASPPRVVLVTSSVHGEGKTTVATNLALALAQIGRVLLIDGDLRDPCVGNRLGLPGGAPGLTDLLTAGAAIEGCIHALDGHALEGGDSSGGVGDGQGLEVLPAGRTTNPIELLSSAPLAQILSDLRGRYDWVLIDSPPVQAVSDAMVLARRCDAAMLVIRAGATPRGLVRIAVGRLQSAGVPVTGAVLNRLDRAVLFRGSRYCRYVDAGFRQYSREVRVPRGE